MKRHGDLLIVKVDELPEGACAYPSRVLAEGEATGHKHELDRGDVYEQDGTLYFKVDDGHVSTLSHQEHHALSFETGIYKVIRQREYTPDGWRNVAD